ncbi:hypothetical protein QMA04_11495 [Planococcus sp. APC 3900]|uniref:coiled-coil domain-containing protein n=1 Tax=Planococcus sp. APC 3900 TaxID=3035191 RepID=UPI0025B2C7C6|nr:hypothetical protein [Planococcus sp. APC 3900]MDN3438721.1 hypothetical protein [Planococcus sp. APC 3900]
MGKRIVVGMLIAFSFMLPVYGHLSGAFADFLAIVHDRSTLDQLTGEMEETRRQIEELQPEVDDLEVRFKDQQHTAVEQLQLYADSGLDVWLSMMQDGDDAADLLGSQWLMERGINSYLEGLNGLYLQYQQLNAQKESLEGHEELLSVIEFNLQARDQYLSDNAGLPLEQIANYLDIDWVSEVEYPLIDELKRDRQLIDSRLEDWFGSSQENLLEEAWLNKQSELRYFFRKDHIYVEYKIEEGHVILLGQLLQDQDGKSAGLVFEAGFYNGFYLPEELLEELDGFRIDYSAAGKLNGTEHPYFTQKDGTLELHRK